MIWNLQEIWLNIYSRLNSHFFRRREFTKELIEKCIAAINELPNCPNGHSDVYDKATIERVLKNVIDN